jgi:Zn-dependent protease with chaperone function
MIRALETLGRENLVNLTPHPFRVALYDSHPPLAQRIAALESSA